MDSFSGFAPVSVLMSDREDGTILLDNAISLGSVDGTLLDWLTHWAKNTPDAVFLTEPTGSGPRRVMTYGEAGRAVDDIAARLLNLPVSSSRPVAIVGGNGIDHAIVMLAATSVGIPAAIVSPAYCAPAASPWGKLDQVLDLVEPGMVFADDPDGVARALAARGRDALPVRSLRDLAWLEAVLPANSEMVATARSAVTQDTVAKLLLTSGSTGSPKVVGNTQRMLVSNMAGLAQVWPFLRQSPPVLLDWLPWNHTFGGNCCFNIALAFGGTMHIDEGKPAPGLIEKTVASLRECQPTTYFNVPAGYDALLPFLETDHDLARRFFGGLDLLFNAGAAMPDSTRARLSVLANAVLGRVPPIVGGWGATETAPFSTVLYFDTGHASNLGVPIPGTTIKLVPAGGRTELRVRGPNVMPGYWGQPEATAAVFDEEGFYCIGDAGRFVEEGRPEAGILFDGRIAENFKLSTGTWVNVGALRLSLIVALSPLISDAVIAGEGQSELGALFFVNEGQCRSALGCEGALPERELWELIGSKLAQYNEGQTGSSTRIARFAILDDPPSAADNEITEKGYLNQRAVLRRRAATVEALYADEALALRLGADA